MTSGPSAGAVSSSTPDPGEVVAIHTAAERQGALVPRTDATVIVNQGIEHDRNFGRAWRRNVTFVEEERLIAVCRDLGTTYEPGCSRRNVTTRGIRLNDLVGRRFRVGTVELLGMELCQPCRVMETSISTGAEAALRDQAGIRARALTSGTFRVGDRIEILEDVPASPGSVAR
jgi:MOSC domain-containing protein YiiM